MTENINQYGQKKAYSYNKETGEYTGVVWTDPSPRNEGQYLLPANATFMVLDDAETGYSVVYQDGEKHYVIDQRGVEYWTVDGIKQVISKLGEKVPEEAFLEEPVLPPTQEQQTALANSECSKRIEDQWSKVGQSNALFGVYGNKAKVECGQWIAAHRTALNTLLARKDLTDLDVVDDAHWPISLKGVQAKLLTKKKGLFGRLKKNTQPMDT